MNDKKFKYQELLAKFPNCPDDSYVEMQKDAFRWVHGNDHENDFKPLGLINDPPQRIIDDSDKMCQALGLSMLISEETAYNRYKSLYKKQRGYQKMDFINDKGKFIALLRLECSDGVAGDFADYGHFTFHEYESANLKSRIQSPFLSKFDADGKFIN